MVLPKFLALVHPRSILTAACAVAVLAGFMVSRPRPALADDIVVPPVPDNLAVPEGNQVFLEGRAVGT